MRVAALLFLFGIGYLTCSWLFESSVYYIGVAEALELNPQKLAAARIFGTVQNSPIQSDPDGKEIIFTLEDSADKQHILKVRYSGMIPDTFQAGSEVFVEGKLGQNDSFFTATSLVTKCPSKYQKENRS